MIVTSGKSAGVTVQNVPSTSDVEVVKNNVLMQLSDAFHIDNASLLQLCMRLLNKNKPKYLLGAIFSNSVIVSKLLF